MGSGSDHARADFLRKFENRGHGLPVENDRLHDHAFWSAKRFDESTEPHVDVTRIVSLVEQRESFTKQVDRWPDVNEIKSARFPEQIDRNLRIPLPESV